MSTPPNTIQTRAQPADVVALCDFDPSITNLRPFIITANQLVTEICASTGKYSAERLKLIEAWLACHFLAVRDPRYQSETIGAASATIQGGTMGMNLGLTPYGQQAMLLDTAGGLAWLDQHISRGKRQTAGITYLGTCKRAWVDYPWRFYTDYWNG